MIRNLIETFLFATVAINAALLIFIYDIFGKMMKAIDEAEFKKLIVLMYRYSSRSPFMILVLNLPLLAAIPYYYRYGFNNWWMTAGLAVWLIAGSLSKAYKLPVYKSLSKPQNMTTIEIEKERRKFNKGNLFQAILYSFATILIALGLR